MCAREQLLFGFGVLHLRQYAHERVELGAGRLELRVMKTRPGHEQMQKRGVVIT